ncbi:MAG: ParB N-terminal domain-containing protein [Aggregatilineales bacterium]
MTRKKREINTSLLDSVTADMLGGGENLDFFHDDSVRVERILLELVRPDPIQPRRVLPEHLHYKFHNNQLTPTQSLRELVQMAQVAARQQGRPFSNVLELLPDPESETENTDNKFSPEEDTLRDLVHLAVTIRDDGQINPLTVVDMSQGVVRQYRIETGERRYWAAWILRDFIPGYDSNGMIDCIVVPAEGSSVFRQAKENTARKGLTAIAMARQAALLLLTVHGYEIPNHAVNNDFYRQALDLDLRGKREYTEVILSAMGGIKRSYFSYYKSLLKLSDEAMELADRHNIDEKKLRSVATIPPESQFELLRQVIDFDLTSAQIKQLIEADPHEVNDTEEPVFSRYSLKVAKSVRDVNKTNGNELAQALLAQEKDVHIALARLRAMQQLLNEAEQQLLDA